MARTICLLGLLAASLISLAVPRSVHAHVVLPRLQATRRVVLGLARESSLEYIVTLGPRQAFLTRQEADVNHDGVVDSSEASALVERWTRTIGDGVSIVLHAGASSSGPRATLGTRRLATATSDGLVGPDGEVGDATPPPLTVRCSWSLPLDDETDRLELTDAVDLAPFEHSELEVRDSPTRHFVGIGVDPQRMSTSPHLAFVDDASGSPRVVWIAFQPSPPRGFPWGLAAIAGLVVALVAWGGMARRR